MGLMQLELGFLSGGDEVVVSALAPMVLTRRLQQQISKRGAGIVFADVDGRDGAITRATLESAITSNTRAVLLTAVGKFLPVWEPLLASTEPREIRILTDQKQGQSNLAATKLGVGVEAAGGALLRFDFAKSALTSAQFAANLRRGGIEATAVGEQDFAFECSGLGRRHRRSDYPGALFAAKTLLHVPDWDLQRAEIEAYAFAACRQESFDFMQPQFRQTPFMQTVVQARPVASESIAASAPPAKRRLGAGSRR